MEGRCLAAEARIPKYFTRWKRGAGTRAASFSTNSPSLMITCVVPPQVRIRLPVFGPVAMRARTPWAYNPASHGVSRISGSSASERPSADGS